AVQVDDTIADLSHAASYARVAAGAHVQTFSSGTDRAIGTWSPIEDCHRYDGVSSADAALRADAVVTPDGRPAMRLQAQRHSACLWALVDDVRRGDVVRIAVAQRSVRGAAPRTCLWLDGRDDCAALDWSATPSGDWYEMSAVTRLPAGAGAVRMFLYADAPAD